MILSMKWMEENVCRRCCISRIILGLCLPKLIICSFLLSKQRIMATRLHHLPTIKDDYLVAETARLKSVADIVGGLVSDFCIYTLMRAPSASSQSRSRITECAPILRRKRCVCASIAISFGFWRIIRWISLQTPLPCAIF